MTTNFHDADLQELRAEVAAGCRVLASRDLSPGFLGHISLRLDDERILVRCRGPREAGLAHTTSQDVRVVTLDGEPGLPGELDGWTVPHELPLHTRILRRRPDVRCVVHAHPRRTVAADLAGLTLEPLVGAYDIPGSALVADGVPVYPRSVLVASDALGDEVADHLGGHAAALLRGHGVAVTGGSVPEAVLRAVSIDEIAHLCLLVASAGGRPRAIDAADRAELPDLGGGLNLDTAWRHELARLPGTPHPPPGRGDPRGVALSDHITSSGHITSSDHITEITQLYARYSHAIDARDRESFLGCFTPDGRIEITGGPAFAGAEALAGVVAARTAESPRHENGNVLVDLDGDGGEHATGRAYFVLRGADGRPAGAGEYLDRLARTEAGWRFTSRRITFSWRA